MSAEFDSIEDAHWEQQQAGLEREQAATDALRNTWQVLQSAEGLSSREAAGIIRTLCSECGIPIQRITERMEL